MEIIYIAQYEEIEGSEILGTFRSLKSDNDTRWVEISCQDPEVHPYRFRCQERSDDYGWSDTGQMVFVEVHKLRP